MNEHLDRYLEGWANGDLEMIVGACAEDFVMDDPAFGRFRKAEYRAYFDAQPEIAPEFTEIVTKEVGGLVTQWGWYKQASLEGAFLNKAGPDGVHSTRVTYYAPAPQDVRGASGTEASA
jgi:hypothetical protein